LQFRFYPFRFHFRALDSIHFPAGQSSNILRGAFGTIFRRIACLPECPGARTCQRRQTCPYALIFEPGGEPRAQGRGPSGLADRPRPFVFRANHLDGRIIGGAVEFYFDLNLFDLRGEDTIGCFTRSFEELAQEGLGPRRGRAELISVEHRNGTTEPLALSLDPPAEPVGRVRVRFLTPTELKSGNELAERPEFGILAARVRDRVATLAELYGQEALDIDFRGFGERARQVKMTRCQTAQVAAKRRSSRTGQVHSIGGFTGEAEYQGDLAEFVPYLQAAAWTGVGRQTVWGKGQLEIEVTV
jgi:hypothetical protein